MSAFKKTVSYSRSASQGNRDALYWKNFGFPVTIKEFGAIDFIDFSPVKPYFFAASSTVKVHIYNPVAREVHRKLTRFNCNAYGGTFRKDGKLLVAGGEDGCVHLYDVETSSQLRVFKGHKKNAGVHRCVFTDNSHIASCCDDKSVRFWDVPTETCIKDYHEHEDYVRAGVASQASPGMFLSGSYDHSVKLFDSRMPSSVLTVSHGSPVESVLMFPSGGIFLSAGGTDICVWDALAGGRLIAKISQHNKTITCLAFATNEQRLLSGSLDKMVKVYDVANYQVINTQTYPSTILSLGISKDDSFLAVGMVDGLLSIQQRKEVVEKPHKRESNPLKSTKYISGKHDTVFKPETKKYLEAYDQFLKGYNHKKTLDYVMKMSQRREKLDEAMAVVQELIRRSALRKAVAGRDDKELSALLRFINYNIVNPPYARIMIDLANVVLDLYSTQLIEGSRAGLNMKIFKKKLDTQIQIMNHMMCLKGSIEMILSAANATTLKDVNSPDMSEAIRPGVGNSETPK